ncbi:MAG TPA: hypothetical protein VMI54_20355 [Polyangiaceae bacterium]|nr:hypothetical protein [Polyangiaceae bacterium]
MRRRGNGTWLEIGSLAILCFGCNSEPAAKTAADASGARDTRVIHEPCDTSSPSAERLDANGDGKAEIIIVKKNGIPVCQAADLNLDGRVDVYTYYDGAGQVRRREYDFDHDGAIDEIIEYRAGVPVKSERATLLANRLDTWDTYQNGVLARSERDSDADAIVDQWWEYPKPGCPLIHTDANQDGKPDPGTTIDYCKETGYVPPERQYYQQAKGPDFQEPTAVPTEVESQPAEAPAPSSAPAAAPAPAAPASAKPGAK